MDANPRAPRGPGASSRVLKADAGAILASLAAHVRRLFVAHYQQAKGGGSSWGNRPMAKWDGGEDAQGRVHKPIWPKIAQLCALQKIEPAWFIEAQFTGRKGGDDIPMPNMLLSLAAMDRYRKLPVENERVLRLAWFAQMEHLEIESGERETAHGETPEVAAFYILADPSTELSGLFRYCVACQVGNAALKKMFEVAALNQYVFRRHAYDRAWPEEIPPALKLAADAFLSQVAHGGPADAQEG